MSDMDSGSPPQGAEPAAPASVPAALDHLVGVGQELLSQYRRHGYLLTGAPLQY
jgi:hypothetical protein